MFPNSFSTQKPRARESAENGDRSASAVDGNEKKGQTPLRGKASTSISPARETGNGDRSASGYRPQSGRSSDCQSERGNGDRPLCAGKTSSSVSRRERQEMGTGPV
jgi:hypothetical protein